MPHSNFKERFHQFNSGIGKCPCGQTFEYTSERDIKMKLRKGPRRGPGSMCDTMHCRYCRFCFNPPVAFDKIGIPKKSCMLRKQQLNEVERIRKVHNYYLSG